MATMVTWVRSFAQSFGAGGLLVSTFLDSSFLSLPEVNDLLLVWLTTQHESRMLLYAASATIGSMAGCLVLYAIGRRGAGFADRFGRARVDRTLAAFRRFGVLAVMIPAILPPPVPFKPFVVLAGVAGIGTGQFLLAVALGRGVRYFGEGVLAVRYGDEALRFLHANGPRVSLALCAVLVAGLVGYVGWRKATKPRG